MRPRCIIAARNAAMRDHEQSESERAFGSSRLSVSALRLAVRVNVG
jgi:hypothetical protein